MTQNRRYPLDTDLLPGDSREGLYQRGAGALSEAELLALLLGGLGGGQSPLEAARAVLRRTGGVSELARRGPRELCRLPGIGPARASAVLAAIELGKRAAEVRLFPGAKIRGPEDVFENFHKRLRWAKREHFFVLLLDARHKIQREERVSLGTLTASLVHPREVFREAVRDAAAALVLVHNHPSGDPTPSSEDRVVTRRLAEAGAVLGIRIVDHVVVAERGYYSFQAEGILEKIPNSPEGVKSEDC